MSRSNVSRSLGVKGTVFRLLWLSVIGAFMSAAIFFAFGMVFAVLFGRPSVGGGQAGFEVGMVILAAAVFIVCIPVCVAGGTIVFLILTGVNRRWRVQPLVGLVVGTLVGLAIGLIVAGLFIVTSEGLQFRDTLETVLLCVAMATPVGGWYGWMVSRRLRTRLLPPSV